MSKIENEALGNTGSTTNLITTNWQTMEKREHK